MLPLHPLIVHFPIALLIGAMAFLLISYIKPGKADIFRELFKWNLLLGTIGSIAAVISGLIQEDTLIHNEAIHELMELHEKLGIIFTTVFILLNVWLWWKKPDFKKPGGITFSIVFVAAILVMAFSAHLGGRMVYEQGAGVKPMEQIILQNGGSQHHHHHGDKDDDHDEDHNHSADHED